MLKDRPFVGSVLVATAFLAFGLSIARSLDHSSESAEAFSFLGLFTLKYGESFLVLVTFLLWWATRNLVEGAKESSIKELRAYVGVTEIEVVRTMDNVILAVVSFKNSGKTPAHGLTSWICQGVLDRKAPNESSFQRGEDEEKGGVLVPGVTWTRHRPIALHNLNMGDLEKESDAIWVWGGIDYRDSFGEPCSVSFRFWVGGKRFRRDSGGQPEEWWPLIPHKNGNKAIYGDKTPS